MLDNRCQSMIPMPSGMYRCTLPSNWIEGNPRHTEHYYNYYRELTEEEKARWGFKDRDNYITNHE